MESLTEKVYECNLAVEAHMICDLLSQAGISARVDGEFLQSAAGEIPLGNTVKVRVDPSRAAEAREVIADWENLQPQETAAPAARPPRYSALLWSMVGALVGGTTVFLAFNTPRSGNGVDYDGDGNYEATFYYWGSKPSLSEYDRDDDGEIDVRWDYDLHGIETGFESDDDFDGKFEWHGTAEKGWPSRVELDADGDGRPEQVQFFEHGVLARIDYHFASGGLIVKREYYKGGLLDSAEFDDDRNGVFERRVRYDRIGEPVL